MLLIFNPDGTGIKNNCIFPLHEAINPSASIHFPLEIEKEEYPKNILVQKMESKSKRNKHGETN
jgi:hypothetical protein